MLWKTWEKAGWMTTLVHYYLIYSRIKTCQAWPNIFNQLPCVSFLPQCTSDAIAGPSHTAGHEDTVPAQTTARGASTDYKDPSRMSPPVFSGSAHDGGCIFVPTPGMPTPPLAHVEPTMPTSSLIPYEKVYKLSIYWLRTLSRWWVCEDRDALLRMLPITGSVMVCTSSTLPIFSSYLYCAFDWIC